MKKLFFYVTCLAMLASCMETDIVDKSIDNSAKNVPIGFVTNQRNITRATNLEDAAHYNFGVFAWKVGSGMTTQKVMDNYLVGYSDGSSKGYDKSKATTWAGSTTSVTDHVSPWFYEGLGTAEYTYTGTDGFYKSTDTEYMSANTNQYLRFWDLAYTNTNFYCYAPYKKTGVTATMNTDGTVTLSYGATALNDGYDNTPNTAYHATATTPAKDRSLAENMYAGVQKVNANKEDVVISFKHTGAQVFICFYEDVPGYKVEIVDLDADNGNMASTATTDQKKGIQATPSVMTPGTGGADDTYAKGSYYTTSAATVSFNTAAAPTTLSTAFTGATTTQENLMFYAPTATTTAYATSNVPTANSAYAANLTPLTGAQDDPSATHYTIPEYVSTGTQTYAWSPTIYYPVAQPASGTTDYKNTGFTFHVTYRIIADDNKEVTTVHNATVHVPASVTTWASNTRYIYRFKITMNSSGSTDPTPSTGYDPTDATPSTDKSLFPIVFDGATIDDYTDSATDHVIN